MSKPQAAAIQRYSDQRVEDDEGIYVLYADHAQALAQLSLAYKSAAADREEYRVENLRLVHEKRQLAQALARARAEVWREAAQEVLFKAYARDAAIAFALKAKHIEESME